MVIAQDAWIVVVQFVKHDESQGTVRAVLA